MPWVVVFVGYFDLSSFHWCDVVPLCQRGRRAFVVCCGDNMFLHIACEAVRGVVVG